MNEILIRIVMFNLSISDLYSTTPIGELPKRKVDKCMYSHFKIFWMKFFMQSSIQEIIFCVVERNGKEKLI